MPEIVLNPDPRSTYGASQAYKDAWWAEYGSTTALEDLYDFDRPVYLDDDGVVKVSPNETLMARLGFPNKFTVSPEPPASPSINDVWIDSDAGDTGRRVISAFSNSWTVTNLYVRRFFNTVEVSINGLSGSGASADGIYTLPAGFVPQAPVHGPLMGTNGVTSSTAGLTIASNVITAKYTGSRTAVAGSATLCFLTGDAWPTSLPGAAG